MSTTEQTLSTLDRISLAEMDSVALMNRTDTKYVLNAEHLPRLLENVGHTYRVLCVDSICLSPYCTLYFDTPEHECFVQHHNGKLNRQKFRIRQYQTSGIFFLEVKAKNNKGRTNKRRIPIDGFKEILSSESAGYIESITGKSLELVPQLWSHFSRITLVDRRQPERVTLDLNLEFSFNGVKKGLPRIAIVEVKQERESRCSSIRGYLRQERIRPMRISKYCLGSTLLKPHLKSNRFKPKLRAIHNLV